MNAGSQFNMIEARTALGTETYWGGTTDPATHDPSKFRYLVHMDNGISPENPQGARMIQENQAKLGQYYVDNLAELALADIVSGSLISHSHQKTFKGRMGLILDVPAVDIIVSSDRDVYSSYSSRLQSAINDIGIMDPDELLAKSRGYNEVVFSGENARVAGLLYLLGEWHGKHATGPDFNFAQTKARELDIPLVTLTPQTR